MIKTTIREIKGSFGRYLAIFAIVMLGVALFIGLKATTPAMIATEQDYLREQHFYDFRLLSTIGFEPEDVERLAQFPEIEDVEGTITVDAICAIGDGNESVYKLQVVPERINQVVLSAGRMPERSDECVLDDAMYDESLLGAKITVTENNGEDTLDMLHHTIYTVVGFVRSPCYINFERGNSSVGDGKIAGFFCVPKEAFDCDYLTEIYLTTKSKYDVYTDEYNDYIDSLQDGLEDKTEELALARYTRLVEDAQVEIDDARIELADKTKEAQEELADAWQEILDGEKEILDGEQDIADGEKEIRDGEREIADAEQEIRDGEKEIADGEREIQEKEVEIADAEEELSYHEWEIFDNEIRLISARDELEAAKGELSEQENALAAKEAELLSAESDLEEMKADLEAQREEAIAGKKYIEDTLAAVPPGVSAELDAMRPQLEEQLAAIDAGLAQIQDGLNQINSGQAQMQEGKEQIQAGKEQLRAARDEITYNDEVLKKAEEELQSAKDEVTKARQELEDGKEELAKAKQELEDGKAELADGRKELAKARTELADAKIELEDGKAELEDGRIELADGKKEYEDAKAEFEEEVADAQQKIEDAQKELNDIEEPDEYVLTRNANVGYACYESDSNIVAGIANVFPVFFFLVAALICMTTMNRMVEEQRTQIGVLKALGYGNAAIMGKFLFYAGSAAATGAAAGCAVGTWLFPKVIWTGYRIMYSMGDIQYYFDIWTAILSMAAALLCSVGAAYFSCRYELYSEPANLIRPKAPKSGKRIFLEKIPFIWSRMKFLHKVSARNLIRYKKRFFMMILGISGCTALLVTGFGIKDSVTDVADMQYDEIQMYDIGISFSEGLKEAQFDALTEQTEDMLSQIAFLYEESVDMDFGGKTKSVYLEIPENVEEIAAFLSLHTKDGEEIPYPGKGEAVLTEKIAENMGIKAGDKVTLRDSDMNQMTVTVSALCENFVSNYIYIHQDTYEEQLGIEPEYKNAYAMLQEGADAHEASAALSDRKNVLSVTVIQDMRERLSTMMESMDYIVALIIICAASLAFIVLYNLTNINITERIREIATIKVLGFYAKETADYVFRENMVLTGMGGIVGLFLGKWLHWFVMRRVNIDMVSFKILITPLSYVLSLLFTFAFAAFVNLIMFFKLEKINMAESLKSIE
ncbi:MAG: ABC transporter permease [Bacillus sp. (in: Bacteria)]|nr:ABC transporter permease [Bacillus sp. (in: firmicutes)]MCM1426292.1 ABC transporter permease [Eubacterium sp.]